MPKIFISHSWEDSEVSGKLVDRLRRDGFDTWIDYEKITGDDSLPKRIGDAPEWCDTLILIWSKDARESYYVNLGYGDLQKEGCRQG